MKKNKKISIIINDLSFFYSHRLPIAEELIKKVFEVLHWVWCTRKNR